MNELSLREIQEIELNILKKFHKLCIEQGFKYSLCGGTLLGAVRHSGFIPWDDDIDIMMPRPDYDRMINFCIEHKEDLPFELLSFETNKMYKNLFAKIIDPTTELVEINKNIHSIKTGVFIDIFAIDGLGDTYEASVRKFNKSKFNQKLLQNTYMIHYCKSKHVKFYLEPLRFLMFIFSRFTKSEKLIPKIEKEYKDVNFDDAKYAAIVCGLYGVNEILSKDVYNNFIDITFEGNEFKAIRDYDTYLSSIYEDYMQLPPVEQRVTHHTFDAYKKQ